MYDDLLDNSDPAEVSKDQIIEAMKFNIKEKEKVIQKLVKKVSDLEDALQLYAERADNL